MITSLNISPKYRYERKFVLQGMQKAEVLHFIKKHPALFREIFHTRQINNIYLDTPDLLFYTDNKVGVAKRKKVRVRWYGDTFGTASNPSLEYKIKDGLVGDKWTFPLADIDITKPFYKKEFNAYLQKEEVPHPILQDLKNLSPTLLNSYERTYFQTADKNFRLTLDEKLTYYPLKTAKTVFLNKNIDKNNIILELKYNPEFETQASSISGLFPFRLDKNSKYVNGIDINPI